MSKIHSLYPKIKIKKIKLIFERNKRDILETLKELKVEERGCEEEKEIQRIINKLTVCRTVGEIKKVLIDSKELFKKQKSEERNLEKV